MSTKCHSMISKIHKKEKQNLSEFNQSPTTSTSCFTFPYPLPLYCQFDTLRSTRLNKINCPSVTSQSTARGRYKEIATIAQIQSPHTEKSADSTSFFYFFFAARYQRRYRAIIETQVTGQKPVRERPNISMTSWVGNCLQAVVVVSGTD